MEGKEWACKGEIKDDEWWKYEARKAQKNHFSFDADGVYHSLVDRYARTTQERIEYGKETARLYHEKEHSNIKEIDEEEFFIGWNRTSNHC